MKLCIVTALIEEYLNERLQLKYLSTDLPS